MENLNLTSASLSLLREFYNELLLIERKGKLTCETYVFSTEIFLVWLSEENIPLDNVTSQNMLYFFVWRKQQGYSDLTSAKDISALRSFGEFLLRKGIWKENHALELDKPKTKRALPRVLSVEQVDSLLSAIDTEKPAGVRDRALYELIYSSGLRISEASSLLLSNLHLEEQLLIVNGKGSKERMVPFGDVAKFWL